MREKTTVKRCWKIGAARSLLLQPSTILSKSLEKKRSAQGPLYSQPSFDLLHPVFSLYH